MMSVNRQGTPFCDRLVQGQEFGRIVAHITPEDLAVAGLASRGARRALADPRIQSWRKWYNVGGPRDQDGGEALEATETAMME